MSKPKLAKSHVDIEKMGLHPKDCIQADKYLERIRLNNSFNRTCAVPFLKVHYEISGQQT